MSARYPTDYEIDHRIDERKHDSPPRHRFDVPIATALEVAVLVKGVKNIRDAEKLIEQYAQTVAAEARLQAVIDTSDRIVAAFEAPLARKEPTNA